MAMSYNFAPERRLSLAQCTRRAEVAFARTRTRTRTRTGQPAAPIDDLANDAVDLMTEKHVGLAAAKATPITAQRSQDVQINC